jgi:Carbohydrate-binding module 48 (Isoamylase N-terminal domain)
MTDAERDPVLRRALEELRRVPPPDVEAMRRVVAAAAAARVTPFDAEPGILSPRRGRSIRLWMVVGVAAASAFVGFALRGAWTARTHVTPTFASSTVADPTNPALRQVVGSEPDAPPIPKQFVFNSSRAHRVSVVGDFNSWNPANAPMSRSPDGELWSVTIPIAPGRHMYAFMVDDSLFTLDPGAPNARDPDLGTKGSIVIVGRP